jgi:glycosyltransferase involved in cell wall biosynthesis
MRWTRLWRGSLDGVATARQSSRAVVRTFRSARRAAATTAAVARAHRGGADLALFHQFSPPPGGGGHQFLRAFVGELERRGLEVENNRLARSTRACLLNSYNFDERRLRRLIHADSRVVHRIDGPISVYRGFDDGTDARISAINAEFAHATVFQSHYSLDKHRELGLELLDPIVIPNAVDPAIFHSGPRTPGSRLRLIATAWSDNPNKGAATFAALERMLDWSRYELTFVGRSPIAFERITMLPPMGSHDLAATLREHDAYITASRHEAGSNAVLEALASGLPVVYVDSGSNGELVGAAGVPFTEDEQLPAALERLRDEYEQLRAAISVSSLADVASRYLEALRVRA